MQYLFCRQLQSLLFKTIVIFLFLGDGAERAFDGWVGCFFDIDLSFLNACRLTTLQHISCHVTLKICLQFLVLEYSSDTLTKMSTVCGHTVAIVSSPLWMNLKDADEALSCRWPNRLLFYFFLPLPPLSFLEVAIII